jgi:hypothetical protein
MKAPMAPSEHDDSVEQDTGAAPSSTLARLVERIPQGELDEDSFRAIFAHLLRAVQAGNSTEAVRGAVKRANPQLGSALRGVLEMADEDAAWQRYSSSAQRQHRGPAVTVGVRG